MVTGTCGVGMLAFVIYRATSVAEAYPYDDLYDSTSYGAYGDYGAYDDYGAATTVLVHPVTGVQWSEESASAMTFYEAVVHCAALAPTGEWRMPTRSELESLVDPAASWDVPLHEPFRSTTGGAYLFSGEEVPGRPGHPWIMNLANGHVFNGHGYDGVVRCVRH